MSAAVEMDAPSEQEALTEQEAFALSEALRLAEHGYALTPLRLTRNPEDGKKVARFFLNWRRPSAWSSDPAQIRDWWATYGPCSFAHGCAANGTEGVDLDADRPAWWAEQGHPTGALVHRTPSGSMHHIWAADPDGDQLPQEAGATLGRGVDARNASGLFYAPGSYIEGEPGSYRVEGELPRREALARTPGRVLALFADRAERTDRPADGRITFHDRDWLRARYTEALERLRAHDVDAAGGYRDKLLGASMVLGRLVEGKFVTRERAVADLTAAHLGVWNATALYSANRRDIDRALADGPRKERWREDDGPQELDHGLTPEQLDAYWKRWERQLDGQSDAEGQHGPARRLRVVRASTVKAKRASWLWQTGEFGRIPLGEVSLVAGRGNVGKSPFCLWLAARLTRGELPGELFGQPVDVAIYASEDSHEHTTVPRLIAAGADLDRVYLIAGTETPDDPDAPINWTRDMGLIRDYIVTSGARFLVIDPLVDIRKRGANANSTDDWREALNPLIALAHATGCAVLGIGHFNKSKSGEVADLLSGAHGLRDAIRAVLAMVIDANGTRVLGQDKNNLARSGDDVPRLTYEMTSVDVPIEGLTTSQPAFTITGTTEATLSDLLLGEEEDDGPLSEDVAWLFELVAAAHPYSKAAASLAQEAEARGLKWNTVSKKARKTGLVRSRREGGPATPWVWELTERGEQRAGQPHAARDGGQQEDPF